jgi:hypothetical protein
LNLRTLDQIWSFILVKLLSPGINKAAGRLPAVYFLYQRTKRRYAMENKNIQIVRECIEQITNAKNFDKIYNYYSEECVFYSPPYVGLGFFPDDSSGERLEVKRVVPNSPATEVLKQGDVILRASDENGSWEGYDQLRTGLWGQGKLGIEVTLTLLRSGETIEATIKRGRIDGFNLPIETILDVWRHFLLEEMPDLKTDIIQIMASGDLPPPQEPY